MPSPARNQSPFGTRSWNATAVLLGVSLLANIVLLGAAYWRWSDYVSGGAIGPAVTTAAKSAVSPRAMSSPAAPIDPDTWQHVAAAEPAELVSRLRANGYPPAVIRAIVHAEVRQRYAGRYRALAEEAAAAPYWRGSTFSLSGDPKLERARRALDREVSEAVTQLLGSSAGELSESERRHLRRQYGDLSPEKAAELQRIAADYDDLMNEIRSEARGVMLPEDQQKIAFLEREKRADFEKLLTPEELEGVDLRSSRTAGQLRVELAAFDPSEDEFRRLFRIQQEFDQQFGAATGDLTVEQRLRRTQAQKELVGQIAAALGPERYADYQRTTDPVWQTANRFVERMGLPPTATDQLIAVQRDITQRVAAVRANQQLSAQQQQSQLSALANEATARLMPLLGDRGLAAYKQNTGYWLQALQNAPAPRPPPR